MRRLVLFSLLLFLSGCLLVDDFGARWEEAQPDPCLLPIADSLYYEAYRREFPKFESHDHARAITLGNHHFLMIKKTATDAGGRMIRFEVRNGIFFRLRPNPVMRDAFLAAGDNLTPPLRARGIRLRHDTLQVEALTPEAEEAMLHFAADANYWEVESKTLYNPIRNPVCRFEDRKLDTIDDLPEANQPKNWQKPRRKSRTRNAAS